MSTLLLRLSRALPHELPAALWAFVCFFALLAGYYVLRPLRDEMALQLGPDALQSLFTSVFLSMLAVVPVFGWLTRRFARKQLLPWLYGFFILNLLGFHEVLVLGQQSPAVARVFFVWVSVFNLFAISLFWSLMADLFDTGQARRLVGFIAAGGTVGALTGPVLTLSLVGLIGAQGLVLVSAGLLGLAIVAILALRRWAAANPRAQQAGHDEQPFAGSVWSGLVDILRSPYLLGISAFLLLYSLLSTFLYFTQADLVPRLISDSAQRTRLLAGVDLAVNGVTLAVQLLAFGSLVQRLGVRWLLVLMPLASALGFLALASVPLSAALAVLVAFGIVRRAGEYAISKPARETLFNVLPAEQQYRAKNAIDTLVHRSGDTASAWLISALRVLGLAPMQLTTLAVPVSLLWLGVAWWVGGQAQRRSLP
jgi:ATP:ADP antiporter, AAA family